ncbi:MAG: CrcB family protein [Chloroflexota bacterium]
MHIVYIGIGGFVGAIARYALDGWVADRVGRSFPLGTMVVNLSGALIVGILFALTIERAALSPELRGPLMIGLVGSYTTFSTLVLESWRMAEDGAWLLATTNLAASGLLGVGALIAGLAIGRAL